MMRNDTPGCLSVLAAALALLTGCATTPDISTNTDPSANLSSYKTYGFVAQPGTNRGGNSTPLTSYFETAIAREMDARGYRRVGSDPNLLVNFNANVQERADVQSTPGPMSGGYYGYRAGLYAGPEVETVRYKVGTANIDVVDASQKKVVWDARAEGTLSSDAMQNPQGAVDKAVTQMFAKFPGRAAP